MPNHCQNLWNQFSKLESARGNCVSAKEYAIRDGGSAVAGFLTSLDDLEGAMQDMQEAWESIFKKMPDGKFLLWSEYGVIGKILKQMDADPGDFLGGSGAKISKDGYLVELNLIDPNISDISSLADLGRLKELNRSTDSPADIAVISNLSNLETLHLSVNGIADISALGKLTNLDGLYLDGNKIDDLSFLSEMRSLRFLYLIVPKVTDFSPLAKVTNLKSIKIHYPRISETHADLVRLLRSRGVNVRT